MRILIVSVRGPTNENRRGGAQDYIQFVASPWVEQGHEVNILCAQECFEGGLLPEHEIVDGIAIMRIGSLSDRFRSLTRRTAEIMQNYDAVIENIMGFPLFLPRIVEGRPLIALKHHFEGSSFLRSQGLLKGAVGMLLENILQPLLYRRTPFVVVSEVTKEALYSRWLSPSAKVCVIPPGIEPARIFPGVRRSDYPTIIYYGALDIGRKRVDHLIEAFSKVIDAVPDARLIVGGAGPDEVMLKQAAKGLNVEFRGFLSEDDKRELLEQGWLFASPSMTEGFGITWVEANSAGIPVVVYELGLDTVDDSCSVRVPLGDVSALASALENLLTDTNLLESMEQPCRRNAARFDWKKSSESFMKMINSQLDGRLVGQR